MNFSISSISITRGQALKLTAAAFKLTNAPTALPQDIVFTWSRNSDSEYPSSFTSSRKDESGRALGKVDSFTMADLKAGYISFLVLSNEAPKIQFHAQVAGESASTELSSSFKWAPLAPAFDFDNGPDTINAELNEGQKLTLTRDMLQLKNSDWRNTESADYLGNISAKITKVSGGSFLLNGIATKSFTLDDVHRGIVQFQHDGKNVAPLISLQLGDSKGLNSQIYNLKFSSFQIVDDAPIVTAKPLSLTYKFTAATLIKHPGVGKNVVDGITFWDEAPWVEAVPGQVTGNFVALKSALSISDEETKNAAEISITVQEAIGVHLFKKLSAGGYDEVSSFFASELGSIFLQGESGSSHKLKLNVQAGDSSTEILVPIRNVDADYADYGSGLVKIIDNLAPKLLSFDLGSFDGSPLRLKREMISIQGQGKEKSYDEIQGKYVYTGKILDLDDADDYTGFSDLIFQVAPINGAFFLNGAVTSSFTGAELETGAVSFRLTKPGIIPSFSVVVKDSLGAISGKVIGELEYSPAPQLSVKAPLAIIEGGTLKLTPAMLTVNASAADLGGINIRLATWADYEAASQNSDQELNENAYRSDGAWFTVADRPGKLSSFTYAELAAGKVALVHNGSEYAPSINLKISSAAGQSSFFSVPISFKSVNDAPMILSAEQAPWGDLVFTSGVTGEPRYLELNPGEGNSDFENDNKWMAFDDELFQSSSDSGSDSYSSESTSDTYSADFYYNSFEDKPAAAKLLSYKVTAAQNIKFEKNIAADDQDPVWQLVTQFTQGDLDQDLILTTHTGPAGSTGTFTLVVTDLQGLSSAPVQFQTISHATSNDNAPVINAGAISLKEGGSVTLTSAMLSATDADAGTPDQALRFQAEFSYDGQSDDVTESPLHFVKAGKWIDSFTLAEVKAGKISLIHDGSEKSATLSISVSDGQNPSESLEISPVITWVNDSAPTLQIGTFSALKGQSITLSRDMLNALDADQNTADSSLVFTASALSGGSFKKNGTATTSFSLADIDAGIISFTQDGSDKAPAFSIKVSDGLNSSAATSVKGFINDMIVARALQSDSLVGNIHFGTGWHKLAALDNGNFVVAWGSVSYDINGEGDNASPDDGIYAQILDLLGNKIGSAVQVSTWDTSSSDFDISSTGDGFVVAWSREDYHYINPADQSSGGTLTSTLQAQKFDSSGKKSGAQIALESPLVSDVNDGWNIDGVTIIRTQSGLVYGYTNHKNNQFVLQEADASGNLTSVSARVNGDGYTASLSKWQNNQLLILNGGVAKTYSLTTHSLSNNDLIQELRQENSNREILSLPHEAFLTWESWGGAAPMLYDSNGNTQQLPIPKGLGQDFSYSAALSSDASKVYFFTSGASVLSYDLASGELSSAITLPGGPQKGNDGLVDERGVETLLPLSDGGFLVLWSEEGSSSNPDVWLDQYYLSRYDASGHNLGSVFGSSAADNFTGTSDRNHFAKLGSGDSVNAGGGDDRIDIDNASFTLIDGGNGNDTLSFDGILDLTQIADSKLNNIEFIELRGGDSIILKASDVYAINSSHTLTLFNSDSIEAHFKLADSGWLRDADGHYTKSGATLILDGNVAPVNTAPSGGVVISGTVRQGQTLSASNSLVDADGLGAISYTWKDQAGAVLGSGSSLTLSQSHVGKQISVTASYTDGLGVAESVSSAATANVTSSSGVSITIDGKGQKVGSVSNVAQVNFDGGTPAGYLSWSGNYQIVQGSTSSYSSPTGDLSNKYITTGSGSGATLSIGSPCNYFGLLWGTIDSSNSIQFMSNGAQVASYTGSQINAMLSPQMPDDGSTFTRYVNFNFDGLTFDAIKLTGPVFESDNHAFKKIGNGLALNPQTYAEFKVNSYTNSDQQIPHLTGLSDGGYLVCWISTGQDGSYNGIYAKRYEASGDSGSEFRVNTYTTLDQNFPRVEQLKDGSFVITWHSNGQDGSGWGIYAQRFLANGTVIGSEFRVNTYTTADQTNPYATAMADGGFLITWNLTGQDGSGAGIYAQRYTSNGSISGSPFKVNTYTTGDQLYGAGDILADGSFVISWQSSGQDGSGYGVYAQRYAANGAASGSEFKVNATTSGDQGNMDISALADGGFIITWESNAQDGSGYGIYAQRYAANGTATGSEFKVNTYTAGDQRIPAITALNDGGFVIAWDSRSSQDGFLSGVYAQRFAADGTKSGSEFLINTYTNGNQYDPSLTALADGGFMVSWYSNLQDGSGYGVYAQRYAADGSKVGGATWNGLSGSDDITGTVKNDILSAISSGDVVRGDAGDDLFSISSTDFTLIDGGAGTDTLRLSLSLNLTTIADNKLTNIEKIELPTSGLSLTLSVAEVLAASSNTDTLKVFGVTGSSVTKGAGWIQGANSVAEGITWKTYSSGSAQLWIDTDITVV